ncbi:hypothetical protein [Ruegeria sp. B32]|uniref:hypothetical protein n=1 Tax=Ruegeria sp. B32 TaxID=2867020 RepID=UPI0021A6088A|nr:hypothetical protein [Ruegeria sp. B32]UWR09537.1 hypothetical protein K3752_19410 [Ruegeria sp. B32]
MTGFLGRAIGYWMLAVGFFVAALLITPEPAHAHGGDGIVHAPQQLDAPDPDHAEKGHPGHCHGGVFCNAVGLFTVAPAPPEPFATIKTRTIPRGRGRALAVTNFDPPPPRVLS